MDLSHCWVRCHHPHGRRPRVQPWHSLPFHRWSQCAAAAPVVAILIGATNGGSHCMPIPRHEVVLAEGFGLAVGDEGYGWEDGSSRGGEENSPTWWPTVVAAIWWSTPSTTLYPTSKSCGLQEEQRSSAGEETTLLAHVFKSSNQSRLVTTNRSYQFGKVGIDHRSDLGNLLTSHPTNRVTQAISRRLKSRINYWPDQIGPANVYFSFKLVVCYHAIFPIVLNCKMYSLHMYKRQVVLYRFLGLDDLAGKLPDLLPIYRVSRPIYRISRFISPLATQFDSPT
jgi:hypothetical protein